MWLRSLLLLPLVALTLYGFSERKEVVNGEILTSLEIIETLDLFLNENGELLLNDKVVTLLEIKNLFQQNKNLQVSVKIYPDANKEIKDNILYGKPNATDQEIENASKKANAFEFISSFKI